MYSTMMWLLIFQRDFSNSMGKKKPNLRLARVNPCRRLQPRWRTCYVGARRSALCTTSGFSCLFPSCVHPSPRWLQRGAQPRHWVAAHEEALPITRSCCRPNNNTETSPPPPLGFFWGFLPLSPSMPWPSPASLCPSHCQNPGATLEGLQRPDTQGDSGEMGVSFLVSPSHHTRGVPCPPQPDLVLSPCSAGGCENTCSSRSSLVPPSLQRLKTASCSRPGWYQFKCKDFLALCFFARIFLRSVRDPRLLHLR